jgi:tetratricopeptide (TPR) repeat protein
MSDHHWDQDHADRLMQEGRPAEAVPLYRRGAEAAPEEDSRLLSLAWALHDSGEKAEAALCFERLFQKELERRLFTGFAYDELVRLYREGHDTEALLSVCERAAAAQAGDPGLLRTLGEAYLTAGRGASAAEVFERLCRLDPDDPEYPCLLGEARLTAGDPERAVAAFRCAVRIDPAAQGRCFSRLAEGLERSGYPDLAREIWGSALAVRPDDPLLWMGLGDCQLRRSDPEAAVRAYERAAELLPAGAAACWHRLGNGLIREGLPLQAAEVFARAVAAEPQNPLHHLRQAEALAAGGQYDLAGAALTRAAELNPSLASR